MIGDTMDTDILGGVQMGYRTVLVLSGTTRREELDRFAYRPDVIVDSIADLNHPSGQLAQVVPLGNTDDDTPVDLDLWIEQHT
jgi:NagD protein